MNRAFDLVVIGGGHAGIEAAHAGARLGLKTALVTLDLGAIGRMSCNPAIGGVAKGQLVRDIDALGGLMGVVADEAGIQFRMLNASKGPAVWGPRAQMDMDLYARIMQERLGVLPGLTRIGAELLDFEPVASGEFSLRLSDAPEARTRTRTLIITSGTFLGARMFTGLESQEGGRFGEPAANALSETLRRSGLSLRRLKTGTPARLAADSLDYGEVEEQPGDPEPFPFSFRTAGPIRNRAICWITHTRPETHAVLREGFAQSPMFTGLIEGRGPRYCPSIEDKVNRFADKDSHHLFLEPEGLTGKRIYVNGFSSSLPAEVQDRALRTIPGLRNCRVLRYGYAVEYDAVDATQLHATYESKTLPGLYFAGQVNGTSGYEEAAAQGLLAGINAAHRVQGKEPFLLGRDESYLGVLTDDLVSLDLDEPYRMFTSRAEYRLHLRQDNAEERLMERGFDLGLVDTETFGLFRGQRERRRELGRILAETRLSPSAMNPYLIELGSAPLEESASALNLLRRPDIDLALLLRLAGVEPGLGREALLCFEAEVRYSGFKERQDREIERSRRLGGLRIPEGFDYAEARALSLEARQKLARHRPDTVAQAARLAGVTPADISGLLFHLSQAASPNPAAGSGVEAALSGLPLPAATSDLS